MSNWVFLARAVSHATAEDEAVVDSIVRALIGSGRLVRVGGAIGRDRSNADIARDNLVAVTYADAVIAVTPSDDIAISSVWIELGMAIAAERPLVVVAPKSTLLPFLLRATADASPDRIALLSVATEPLDGNDVLRALDSVLG